MELLDDKHFEAMAYALKLDAFIVKTLCETTFAVAQRQFTRIIEDEMGKTSADTGHGKAQRAFGRKLISIVNS